MDENVAVRISAANVFGKANEGSHCAGFPFFFSKRLPERRMEFHRVEVVRGAAVLCRGSDERRASRAKECRVSEWNGLADREDAPLSKLAAKDGAKATGAASAKAWACRPNTFWQLRCQCAPSTAPIYRLSTKMTNQPI